MPSLEALVKSFSVVLVRVEGKLNLLLEEAGLEYVEPKDLEGPPDRSVLKLMSKPEPVPEPIPETEPENPPVFAKGEEKSGDPMEMAKGPSFTDRIKDVLGGDEAEKTDSPVEAVEADANAEGEDAEKATDPE